MKSDTGAFGMHAGARLKSGTGAFRHARRCQTEVRHRTTGEMSVENRMAEPESLSYDARVPMSVLIVDDHPSFRGTARALLEEEGFDVVGEAEDGMGAIRAAGELQPDVVLLDVQLPDVDGFEVASRLTRNGRGPKVVLTSSRDFADFGELVADSGAIGFVPKAELSGPALAALLG